MNGVTRRRLLAGLGATGISLSGAYLLNKGAANATFESWTPDANSWPLQRYDTENTAHNLKASPPRSEPILAEFASVSTDEDNPYFRPLITPEYIALFDSGLTLLSRNGGEVIYSHDDYTPASGFGPPGETQLYATRMRQISNNNRFEVMALKVSEGVSTTFSTTYDVGPMGGLTVGTQELFVGTPERNLFSINRTGGQDWQVEGMMPALSSGRLYAAGASTGVVAYEERSGFNEQLTSGPKKVWETGWIPGKAHLPAVTNGRVIVGTQNTPQRSGVLAAFDGETGESLWGPRPLGWYVSTPAVKGDNGYGTIANDGYSSGTVASFDLETGATRWQDEVGWFPFSPIVGGETMIVAGETREGSSRSGGKVRAYDISSGDRLWTVTITNREPIGSLALVDNSVFVTVGSTVYKIHS